jgi:DNA (cytosine-5)-methyltransferase 1
MLLTFASLYSGCGGLDLGLARAGMIPVWANEKDPWAASTYDLICSVTDPEWAQAAALFGEHDCRLGGIEEVSSSLARGMADIVAGGPPCQGFSRAGKMDPGDPRSGHVERFMNAVEVVRPLAFIMENVPHLALSPRWRHVITMLKHRAATAGYEVRLLVLDAADYGVPQHRERMFLIGLPPGAPFREPLPAGRKATAGEALRGLPPLGEPGNDHPCTARITLARKPVLRASAYAGMMFNGQGRLVNLSAPAQTLPATMGGNRTPVIDLDQLARPGAVPWLAGYHASLLAGGEPLAQLPAEARMRRLSVEEAAAIQGFPRDMPFQGPQTARFRQVGNAVPPLLAWHVAQAVARSLA